jgi:Domain of unknown function DUF302
LKEAIDRNLGKTGLTLFMELDHGAVLRKETGLTTPKIVRLVIGNPLVMKEMAKHMPEAGSYAPVTLMLVFLLLRLGVSVRLGDEFLKLRVTTQEFPVLTLFQFGDSGGGNSVSDSP